MFFNSNLKNITIPKATTTILSAAFVGCIYLEEFFSNSPEFVVFNKALYSKNYLILYGFPSNSYSDLLPTTKEISSARGLSGSSFTNFTLNIPIETFGAHSIRSCPNLEYVDLSCSKTTILNNAIFRGCTKLAVVILPPMIQTISSYCFSYTSILELVIPSNVNYIDSIAFNNTIVTDIYYCGINLFKNSIYRNDINIHVTNIYPSTTNEFLGCSITDRSFNCSMSNCFLVTDQSFMICPSVKYLFLYNLTSFILKAFVFIIIY